MRTLYIDAFSGISGNMFIGALLDLGVPETYLRDQLSKLKIDGYDLQVSKAIKAGISATYVEVALTEHHHEHHHAHRSLAQIKQIIDASELPLSVKQKAAAVFVTLGQAEAKVHDKPIEEIHFHEVGAVDTIVDIVGSIICLDWLKIEKLYVAKIRTGFGFVKCAHGDMPVPAPATAELLSGMPFYQGEIEKELATPTGVALAKTLAEVSAAMPKDFVTGKVGYGAGGYDLPIPNVLRMYLGEMGQSVQDGSMIVVETNIDDMNPQLYGHVMNKLFAAGASDVWITPIIMKKGRPACLLSVLSKDFLLDDVSKIIFHETSSLGVRYYSVQRNILARNTKKVDLPYGSVHIKYGLLDGKLVNIAPEFEDCANLSALTGKPIKAIWQQAMQKAGEDF